jgi:glyoxylase-like metal-dependent hydrolase (beta-lactamase superfamily II)
MALVYDGEFQVYKVAGMGQFNNNGYALVDPASRECYLVDAPAEIGRLLKEAERFDVKAALITHTHPDHVAGYQELKQTTKLPVAVNPNDEGRLPGKPEFYLNHGDVLRIGKTAIRVVHTPGHTPGGVCLVLGNCLISGDTLFPGGPGRTRSPEAFQQLVRSITTELFRLPDHVAIFPGHGADTTIAKSKQEYAIFAARPHRADLSGDVVWTEAD